MKRGAIKRLDAVEHALTHRTTRQPSLYRVSAETTSLGIELADPLATITQDAPRAEPAAATFTP